MPISEATFGAVDKGHAIIAVTSGAAKVAPRIVGRTDLPNTVPSGTEWASFESGYFEGDTYVLARTWPDPGAPRAGMVFTHAVMAPFVEIDNPDGLLLLSANLPQSPDRGAALKERSWQPPEHHAVSKHTHQLLDALLDEKRQPPIVWLGEADLLRTLTALWRYLPSAARRSVTFRLSFGPEDVAAAAPLVVMTPRQLAQRWKGRTIIDPTQPPPPASEVARSILTPSSADEIAAYANAYGIIVRSLSEFGLLQKSWEIGKSGSSEYGVLLAQLRFVMTLSPQREPGAEQKAVLVADLARAVDSANTTQISALRNINLATWGCGDPLWAAVRAWATRAAALETDAADDIAIWRNATADGAQSAWALAVREGLEEAAKSADGAFCVAWWRRWTAAPELITPVFALLPTKKKMQDALVLTAPQTIDETLAEPVMGAAAGKKWWALHATVARRSLALSAAVKRQLAVDTDQAYTAGFAILFEGLPAHDLLATAVDVEDARLIAMAGDAAAADPTLLEPFDPRIVAWRRIWEIAVRRNADAWQGVGDQTAVREEIVQQLRGGAPLEPSFLEQVAVTPIANLTDVPDRGDVWDTLPEPARSAFLAATATGWLTDFANRKRAPDDADATLRRAIVAPQARDAFFSAHGRTVAIALSYFEAFEEVPEHVATAWLRRLRDQHISVDQADAERIGALVRDRRWHSAASVVAALLHTDGRGSLAPAAIALRGFFQMMDLGMLMVKGFLDVGSQQDVWAIFEDVACELYPHGPNETELWSRAGGKKADLPDGYTGRQRWHATVKLLRNGGSRLSASELLTEMTADHRRNEKLAWLAKQAAFQEE